jgi:hypothetical protein
MTASWWPEGEYREFCESVLEQVYRPRSSWMKRPHLGECFLPQYVWASGHVKPQLTECRAKSTSVELDVRGSHSPAPRDWVSSHVCRSLAGRHAQSGVLDGGHQYG